MAQCLSDCALIPIPKGNKDPSCSQNYRVVALASSVSKILELLISTKYSSHMVSRYIHHGSAVLVDQVKCFTSI